MDKTPEKDYDTLAEIPADVLSGRVVGSLILAKGNANMWQGIIETLILQLHESIAAHIRPQIEAEARAVAIEETIVRCIKAIERLQENFSLEHGRESDGSVEYPEGGLEFLLACDNCIELIRKAVSLATVPAGHQVVPVEPTEEMIDVGHVEIINGGNENFPSQIAVNIYKAMLHASKGAK